MKGAWILNNSFAVTEKKEKMKMLPLQRENFIISAQIISVLDKGILCILPAH